MGWSALQTHDFGSVTTTEEFTSTINLQPGETAHVFIETGVDGTDSLQVSVYGVDNESDTIPMLRFEIDNTGNNQNQSFSVSGVFGFRIGLDSLGGTWTLCLARWRKDGVYLT